MKTIKFTLIYHRMVPILVAIIILLIYYNFILTTESEMDDGEEMRWTDEPRTDENDEE